MLCSLEEYFVRGFEVGWPLLSIYVIYNTFPDRSVVE